MRNVIITMLVRFDRSLNLIAEITMRIIFVNNCDGL